MQGRNAGRCLGFLMAVGFLTTWCVCTVRSAAAEWTFDVYVGRSFASDGDVTANGINENVGFDDSYTVGGRLGYWFGFFPFLGVALDVSYFTSDLDPDSGSEIFADADLRHVPLSGLAMLRLPLLPSPVVPRGHLEPYVAAGPTLFLSNLDVDNDDFREDIGLDVRAGLNWRFTRTLGIFAEYRLTYVEQEFKFTRQGVRTVVESNPSTHHVLAGLSLRF